MVEEEKKDWIENKRRELKNYLEKIKDYQKQDSSYYWFNIDKNHVSKNLNLISLDIENGDAEAGEEEDEDDYYDDEDDYY